MRWWFLIWALLFGQDALGAEWLLFNRCGFSSAFGKEALDSYKMIRAPNIGPMLIRRDWVSAIVRIRKPEKLPRDAVRCTVIIDKAGEWMTIEGTFAEVTKRLKYDGELTIK